MKKTLIALALVASANTAFAGNVADPIIEAPVVVADASSSSNGTTVAFAIVFTSILWAALD